MIVDGMSGVKKIHGIHMRTIKQICIGECLFNTAAAKQGLNMLLMETSNIIHSLQWFTKAAQKHTVLRYYVHLFFK